MRRSTVRTGLNLIIAAVILIILAAFYHAQIAQLLSLSPGSETRFIYLGFLWGGICGCAGISVAIFGLLRAPGGRPRVGLLKPLVVLALLLFMFTFLLFSSLTRTEMPRLRPGETITI